MPLPALSSCIYPTSQAKRKSGSRERFTFCLVFMADDGKVPLHNIFKGAPLISSTTPGKGKQAPPRKNSVASEVLRVNRPKPGRPAVGMSFGVQENS